MFPVYSKPTSPAAVSIDDGESMRVLWDKESRMETRWEEESLMAVLMYEFREQTSVCTLPYYCNHTGAQYRD